MEFNDGVRIAEVYKMLQDGVIPVEPELKQPILDLITTQGIETVKGKRWWSREHPLAFLSRLVQELEEIITAKKTDGEELTEEALESTRAVRVRLYRVLRAVRTLKKSESEEEDS